jgi:hypothetical protein
LYLNTIGHDFTIDDGTVIGNNRFTKEGIAGLPDIFSEAYRAGFWEREEGLYRPLSVALFALEWEFFPDNPKPGHIINILLYALSAGLLCLVLFRLLKQQHPLIPLTAALLWTVHPLHTEVAANIKSGDELLAFLFGLSGLLLLLGIVIQTAWPILFFHSRHLPSHCSPKKIPLPGLVFIRSRFGFFATKILHQSYDSCSPMHWYWAVSLRSELPFWVK